MSSDTLRSEPSSDDSVRFERVESVGSGKDHAERSESNCEVSSGQPSNPGSTGKSDSNRHCRHDDETTANVRALVRISRRDSQRQRRRDRHNKHEHPERQSSNELGSPHRNSVHPGSSDLGLDIRGGRRSTRGAPARSDRQECRPCDTTGE